MEKINEYKEILWYLDKNYYVDEGYYYIRDDNTQQWGFKIITSLRVIFCYEFEITEEIFKTWAFYNGITEDNWENTLNPKVLRASWTPEYAMDLNHDYDVETQLMNILSQELAKEIDIQIIKDLKINTSNDFLGVVRCIGYEPGPTMYDPTTFSPKKRFVGLTQNEINNERQNNPYWQDWIKNQPS